MKKFYGWVIRRRKAVILLFLLAAVCCAFLRSQVSVNYELKDYLPEDSASTVALEVMEEEFGGEITNARVMVSDVTIPEALEYKEQIAAVDGVLAVTWLDDVVDITVPLSQLDEDTVSTYYKDSAALISVTIDVDMRLTAVEEIRDIIGEENAMTGSVVSSADGTANTVSEIGKIALIGVLFVLVVLLLTTRSWLEPFIVLISLGIAILINMGSNLIFGEISFVTNAAGAILQLAVSLDYAVFLLHRFEQCREAESDPESAMLSALTKSTPSILSSGLTTVIGFIVLVLMRYRIGADLGLALAKGVAISLFTAFTFLPALALTVYPLIDKTRHRPILSAPKRLGKAVRRMSVPMVIVFVLVLVPSFLASNSNSYYYGSTYMFDGDTRYGEDTAAIEAMFGESDTWVLMVPVGDTAAEEALSAELAELSHVTSILSYVDSVGTVIPESYLDEDTLALLRSENYSRLVLSVDVPYEGDETFALVEEVRAIAESYYPGTYYLAGEGVSTYDLMDTVTADMLKVNLAAIAAVFLVLLIMMRSIALPVILVLSIETAIWLNLTVPYFMDASLFYIAYLIISTIQLGATVDYAILMADRYREKRREKPKRVAVSDAVSEVTISILTSGSALTVVGLLLGYLSSNRLLGQLGILIGRGAIFSLIVVLFVLPGLLTIFDKLVMRKNGKPIPGKFTTGTAKGAKPGDMEADIIVEDMAEDIPEDRAKDIPVEDMGEDAFDVSEQPVSESRIDKVQETGEKDIPPDNGAA